MNKIRELDGVSDKEDGYIVTYQIIITFFSVELNRKSPNIPHCIRGTLTSCHCGEPHKDGSLVIRILQEFSLSVIVPVSYTHLRAHETDSYLVCRLLLE